MRAVRRSNPVVPITVLFLLAVLALPSEVRAASIAEKVGKWCFGQLVSYGVGKAIDVATGNDLRHELEREIPRLVAEISAAIGPRRAALQESLELNREQLAVLKRVTASQGNQIAAIKADQERLLRRIDGLTARMSKLEGRVDQIDAYVSELDARVSRLEDALIRECLDLRHAPVLGEEGFRVKETPGAWMTDRFESDRLTVEMRLLLNSCSPDLTQRGMLMQLALVTRDLDKDMSLYANFKGVPGGGQMGSLSRQEIPLARPGFSVDGQVAELFFPYGEIPQLNSQDRIAVAFVLTHDGEVLYSLPDRVINCVFGQRVSCRWGR